MTSHNIRVKQTSEGLFLRADDVEQIVASFTRRYPNVPMRIFWDLLRDTRREYVDGIRNFNERDNESNR
jgi:hypothetical protein